MQIKIIVDIVWPGIINFIMIIKQNKFTIFKGNQNFRILFPSNN